MGPIGTESIVGVDAGAAEGVNAVVVGAVGKVGIGYSQGILLVNKNMYKNYLLCLHLSTTSKGPRLAHEDMNH